MSENEIKEGEKIKKKYNRQSMDFRAQITIIINS